MWNHWNYTVCNCVSHVYAICIYIYICVYTYTYVYVYVKAITCICILFLLEHWKCWKKQPVLCFISLLDTRTFYQHSTEVNGFCKMLTLYLLNPAQLPRLVHGNSVFAAPGVLHANRLARNYGCTHIVHIYSCCAKMCLWTWLTKHKFKDKINMNST